MHMLHGGDHAHAEPVKSATKPLTHAVDRMNLPVI